LCCSKFDIDGFVQTKIGPDVIRQAPISMRAGHVLDAHNFTECCRTDTASRAGLGYHALGWWGKFSGKVSS